MTAPSIHYDLDANRMRKKCGACGINKDESAFYRDKVKIQVCLSCARQRRDVQARVVVCPTCDAQKWRPCMAACDDGTTRETAGGYSHKTRIKLWMRVTGEEAKADRRRRNGRPRRAGDYDLVKKTLEDGPLTRRQIIEATGIATRHVYSICARLRRDGVVTWSRLIKDAPVSLTVDKDDRKSSASSPGPSSP